MHCTISEHFIRYYPERLNYSGLLDKDKLNNGIIIRIKLKEIPNAGRKTIFEIPGALKIEAGVYSFPKDSDTLDS